MILGIDELIAQIMPIVIIQNEVLLRTAEFIDARPQT